MEMVIGTLAALLTALLLMGAWAFMASDLTGKRVILVMIVSSLAGVLAWRQFSRLTHKPPELILWTKSGVSFQTYRCELQGTKGVWSEKSVPRAELLNENGDVVAKHGADVDGAWWEGLGGRLYATKSAELYPATRYAIAGLKLVAKYHRGSGPIAEAAEVFREETDDGVRPTGDCTPDTEQKMPYRARYRFVIR